MFVCAVAFLGCTQEGPRAEINQSAAPIAAAVSPSLHKPTLRQAVPQATLQTPARALTAKTPRLKLQQRFLLPRVSPSAI